ncbi:hypothetical protein D3C80_1789490 [compost metagenome]
MNDIDLAGVNTQRPAKAHIACELNMAMESVNILNGRVNTIERRGEAASATVEQDCITRVRQNLFRCFACGAQIKIQSQIKATE